MDRDLETMPTPGQSASTALLAPCRRAEVVRLADGTPVRVEPLRRGDRGTVKRLFARLSPESRLRRFMSPVSALSERDVAFLSDVGRTGQHRDRGSQAPCDRQQRQAGPGDRPDAPVLGPFVIARDENEHRSHAILLPDDENSWMRRPDPSGPAAQLGPDPARVK